MDFYGNINLKDNEIQNLVFEQETSFPVDAVVGSIVFKDNTLYMCVALNVADPIWIPLTASIDTYVHEQEATSTTWTITHNLGEENLILQVYNDANEMVIPDSVTPTDTNEIIVTFNTAIAGRVIVMFGDEIPANGIGIIDPQTSFVVDISLATYDTVSYAVGAYTSSPRGLLIADSGTKMFFVGNSNVFQTTLNTPYILTSVTPNGNYDFSSEDSNCSDIEFNTDGTKMYMVGFVSNAVFQYTLSVAYDITTASYDSVNHSLVSEEADPYSIAFNNDGTKMFMIGISSDTVYQYTLGTGWDLSTISYDSVSLNANSQDATMSGVTFNPNGTQMWLVGNATNSIYQYTLSAGFDLSTASYDSVFLSTTSVDSSPQAIAFSDDGTKTYIAGSTNEQIFQYSTNI